MLAALMLSMMLLSTALLLHAVAVDQMRPGVQPGSVLTTPRSITADSSLSREGVDMEGLLALLLVLMIPGLLTFLPSSSSGGRSSRADDP